MPTPAGVWCPPTIFSMTGPRTIPTRSRKAERTFPGFNALYTGRAQLLDLGDTKTLSPTAVNEFHFSYMRDANDLGKPVGGVGVSLASQGFEVGPGNSRNRGAVAQDRRSGECRLQQLHDGHQHQ